jgi:hypothetical protein
MKPSTLEWIAKAEGDFVTAQMSYRARKIQTTMQLATMLNNVQKNI